jgi:serine/threonine protein kinase
MQKENLTSSKSFSLKLKEKYKKLYKMCKKYKCTNFLSNYIPLSHGRYSIVLLSKDKSHITKVFYEKDSFDELKNEIKVINKLNEDSCDNIIKSFGHSYNKECPLRYIKYEYCEGSELFCWDTEDLNDLSILNIIEQLSNALKHTHDKNIIHCDIKMENIFLKYIDMPEETDYIRSSDIINNKVQFKLGDWNLASFKNVRGRYGTTEYMSPEVVREKHITKKNDIWSLGVLLYQLVYYDYPFTNDRDKITMLLIKRYADGHHKLEFKDSIFADLIQKLLEPDITKRICIDEVIEEINIIKICLIQSMKEQGLINDDDEFIGDQEDEGEEDEDQEDDGEEDESEEDESEEDEGE